VLNLSLLTNQTTAIGHRWTHPGDNAPYQQLTTVPYSPAGKVISSYTTSSGIITNASYLRLKTLALSWRLPQSWLPRISGSGRLYVQAQNLLTITPYQGTDPETQGFVLPPLRTVEAGLQITFK
jgi:hypothetical protein